MTNDAWLPDDLVSIAMPGFGGGILSKYRFVFEETGMTHELVFVLTAIALFLIAFAREKDEDEYCMTLRLKSWVWACQDSNGIHHRHLSSFFSGMPFLYALVANMFLVFVLFRAKFDYELWKSRKEASHENRIRVLRAELDMTQLQLAEHIGVSRQSIVAIENSKYVPSTIFGIENGKAVQYRCFQHLQP